MLYRWLGLLTFLSLSGCASIEEPRWALLGDTERKAYLIDRQEVQRLSNGNYRFPVKSFHYEERQPHKPDEQRESCEVLGIEMDCRRKQWRAVERYTVDKNGKVLFRLLNSPAAFQAVEPTTIHLAAYNYLCGDSDIVAQHNH